MSIIRQSRPKIYLIMYGYIYKTTDKVTNKIYIGKKTATNFKGIDYIGSGLIVSRIK